MLPTANGSSSKKDYTQSPTWAGRGTGGGRLEDGVEAKEQTAGGSASPKKAAAFDMFADLIKNAEYSHSSKNDEHSNRNKKVGGRIDWDYFVSVAKIGNEDYPVIFKIRSIDQDIRSQIYEITAKNETGSSHSDGHQESLTDVQPNYGGTPISDGTIPHQKQEVNEKFSLRSQITTPQQFTRWAYEAEAAKAAYGDIDFGLELQNSKFVRLLQSGVGVKDAYFLSHKDEILMQVMHAAALSAEEKVNRRMAQNRARPRENGLDSTAAFITKPNISHMTKADRKSIARRVANGERIVF